MQSSTNNPKKPRLNTARPYVGMGATQVVGSDRYPYTVVEIRSQREIVLQQDAMRNMRSLPEQDWKVEPNPLARREVATFRKNGLWYPKGQTMSSTGWFQLGIRDPHIDPHL